MKKIVSVLLAVCTFICCIPLAYASTGDVTVTPSTPIVISKNATQQEQFAAERLSYYLGLVFGTEHCITQEAVGAYIAVGSAANADISKLNP